MKIIHILAIVLTILTIAIPIYGILKKVRTKIVISGASAFLGSLSILAILNAADITTEKLGNIDEVQKLFPYWENFYRLSTIFLILAFAINIYYLAKEIRD